MTAVEFNKIYRATKLKSSSSARTSYILSEINDADFKMTSSQATRLIQLVNSENSRLILAKAVYPLITDVANFSMVSNLLKSSSNRADLNNYIASLPVTTTTSGTNAAYAPLTSQRFNVIYNEVVAETGSNRTYYLMNFFNKSYNYYTSAQVRQLLQLINSESDILDLAKTAYRGITDRNYFYNEISPLLSGYNSRTELQSYISTYDTNNGTTNTNTAGVAMTATAYNSLYQNIYYQAATARYNSVYTALTTSGNYFTSAQVRQLISLVADENSRLALAKASIGVLVDRSNYTIMNDLFSYQSSRNELATYVSNYGNGSTTTTVGMSDADFNTIYRNINSAWTSSSKYSQASLAFQNTSNRFSVSQVRQLLLLISSETERLALAKLAYDNIVDQYNYAALRDVFTSDYNKGEWSRYVIDIQNGGTGVGARVAMSDSEYNTLLRNVQFTFGFGAKYSALTDIFNKETNYFTVTQIKELVRMVSNESNRLELAKLAYNNAVDPANYTNLFDLFTSQTTKDELSAYISSNTYNR
jgi:hypothetical protein